MVSILGRYYVLGSRSIPMSKQQDVSRAHLAVPNKVAFFQAVAALGCHTLQTGQEIHGQSQQNLPVPECPAVVHWTVGHAAIVAADAHEQTVASVTGAVSWHTLTHTSVLSFAPLLRSVHSRTAGCAPPAHRSCTPWAAP